MDKLYIKTLLHIKKILDGYDSMNGYRAIYSAFDKVEIDPKNREKILSNYREASSKEDLKVIEAIGWIDSLIESIKS